MKQEKEIMKNVGSKAEQEIKKKENKVLRHDNKIKERTNQGRKERKQ
jgi:hypothetical protein